jgi:hypothetical protein
MTDFLPYVNLNELKDSRLCQHGFHSLFYEGIKYNRICLQALLFDWVYMG